MIVDRITYIREGEREEARSVLVSAACIYWRSNFAVPNFNKGVDQMRKAFVAVVALALVIAFTGCATMGIRQIAAKMHDKP